MEHSVEHLCQWDIERVSHRMGFYLNTQNNAADNQHLSSWKTKSSTSGHALGSCDYFMERP